MAIIGALAGTAIPVYIGMRPSIKLSGATRQIMGDLMWARMQAISQNNEFKISFLADNYRYTILDDDDNDGNIDAGESIITRNIQDKYSDVTFGTATTIFHPGGNAAPTATITIINSFGTKTVTIAITGRVKKQ